MQDKIVGEGGRARWGMPVLVMLVGMLTFLLVSSAPAFAKITMYDDGGTKTVVNGSTHHVVFGPSKGDKSYTLSDEDYGWNETGRFSSAKSKNTKVATVKMSRDKGQITVKFKKPGKAKIVFKYKGKKKAITLVAHKYRNPLKSFKVGGKEYAGKYKKATYYSNGSEEFLTGTVDVTPASGWKLVSIKGGVGGDELTDAERRIKNHSSLKWGREWLEVTLKNPKMKVTQACLLWTYEW